MLLLYEYAHLGLLTEELKQLLPKGSLSSRLWKAIGNELHYRLVDYDDPRETEYSRVFPIEALFVWATKSGGIDPEWLASEDGSYLDDKGDVIPPTVKPAISAVEQLAAYGLWLLDVEMNALGPIPEEVGNEDESRHDEEAPKNQSMHEEENAILDEWMPWDKPTEAEWGSKRGENKYGWKRDQVIEHHAACLLNAYQALMYAQRALRKIQPTPEQNARAEKFIFSALGKAGAKKRHAPMAELQAWAVEKYKVGKWKSANQAAHKLKEEVLAYGRTIKVYLSEENAQRTIAEWFRKSSSG